METEKTEDIEWYARLFLEVRARDKRLRLEKIRERIVAQSSKTVELAINPVVLV